MALALAVGTRAVIGRASSITAMAALATSSPSLSLLPPPRPLTCCSNSAAFNKSFPIPLRVMRCHPLLSSRPLHSCIVASVSSSATSVDTTSDQSPSPAAPLASPPADAAATPPLVEVDALDIRVGRVLKAWKHPEADSLYVEEVDIAESEGPRTICSGLVNYLSLEELEGRAVLVLANLKARNMRGVKSNGMLLAASNAEHTVVQLLSPPEGAAPGERVWFGEETDRATQTAAETPNKVQKKKIWETVQPLLKTTEECVAVFQSKPMRASGGVVTCQSLSGANIS